MRSVWQCMASNPALSKKVSIYCRSCSTVAYTIKSLAFVYVGGVHYSSIEPVVSSHNHAYLKVVLPVTVEQHTCRSIIVVNLHY